MATITKYLEIILNGKDLTFEQAKALQDTIFEGQVTEVQIAAFLAMMRMKRATATRSPGWAQSLRDHAAPVRRAETLIDTWHRRAVKTFNISTTSASWRRAPGRVRRQARQPGHHQPLRLGGCPR
jgi:anthranilate phosphoribosyltransferase